METHGPDKPFVYDILTYKGGRADLNFYKFSKCASRRTWVASMYYIETLGIGFGVMNFLARVLGPGHSRVKGTRVAFGVCLRREYNKTFVIIINI